MVTTDNVKVTMWIFLLFLFILPAGLFAQETDLSGALNQALQNNPELKAARYDLEIAKARLITAGTKPNPTLDSSQSTDFTFANEGEYDFSAGINQPFSISGRINKQKAIAQLDIKLTESRIAGQERLLTAEVKKTFYELLLAHEQLALKDTFIQTARDLAAMTESRFNRGEISQVDVATAQLELQRLIAERERLLMDRQIRENEFNRLLGRPTSTPVLVKGSLEIKTLPESVEELTELAYKNRPDLLAVRYEVQRSRAEQTLVRALKWEDWSAGVSYTRARSIFTEAVPRQLRDTDQLFNFGVSIPIPLWDKKKGPIAETIAAERKGEASLEGLRFGISAEVSGAYARVRKMNQILDFYSSSVLTASEKNIDLVQKAYRQGMANFLQVILANQQMAIQRQSYMEALGEYQQARIDLETAVGKPTGQ